jgi:hypothetical protein
MAPTYKNGSIKRREKETGKIIIFRMKDVTAENSEIS